MAEGRGKLEWAQTSQVLAMLFNVNRDPKRPASSPNDFNPYAPKAPRTGMKTLGASLKGRLPHAVK